MTIETVNFDLKDIDFVEVSVETYKDHLSIWPQLKSYRLGNPDFEYWHEADGKVWSATTPIDSDKLARFFIRREMYQPLLGNDVIDCNCFSLTELCKMLVKEEINFTINVSDDVIRLFEGKNCIARGPINGILDLSPAYDEDYQVARYALDDINTALINARLVSDSPIYVVYNNARILYEQRTVE